MDQPEDQVSPTGAKPLVPHSGLIRSLAGYLIAAACLIWVFHDIDPVQLAGTLSDIRWKWVALAIALDITSYLCQGWRWQLLLQPVSRIPWLRATQAIFAGLFTNEVLPMRFGEFVRAYLVSRWAPTRMMSVVPSMAVERLFDGIWLGMAIGLTVMFVPLPKDLLRAGDILGFVVLIATGLFVYLLVRKQKTVEDPGIRWSTGWKPFSVIRSTIDHLASGLREIGTSRATFLAFGLSLLFLILQALAFWLIMWGYGLRLSFWAGFVVLLIVHLGTAVPNAPANVGTYQFFTVVGLSLFGVDKTLATGFSVVVFLLLTIPLWILGFYALSQSGMTLSHIKSEVKALRRHRNT